MRALSGLLAAFLFWAAPAAAAPARPGTPPPTVSAEVVRDGDLWTVEFRFAEDADHRVELRVPGQLQRRAGADRRVDIGDRRPGDARTIVAIEAARDWHLGHGHGPVHHLHALWPQRER